jgi:phospho-N-acetylmuramoyl-pentapeptide-transferase
MLYNLLYPSAERAEWMQSWLTVPSRAALAFFVALALGLLFGGRLIEFLRHHQKKGQPIREDGPQSHLLTKKGTPTMGGLLILGTATAAILLFASLLNPMVWVCLAVMWIYGVVGFADDYVKVTKQTSNAMTAKMKLLLQFMTALVSVLVISYYTPAGSRYSLTIPYFKDLALNLWLFYVPFAMVVIAGASNAVNLSDGLDGLAGGLLVAAFAFFALAAYVCGTDVAQYFYVRALPGMGEVAVVCAAVAGGGVGFLWFNAPPAKVFMGDTGSLALGALLGTVAVMLKQEVMLAIVGGIFVLEALSVMIQVFWFKRTGRRVFKMAPIHHHFEQCGWPETTVVLRFWIVALMLLLAGLPALAMR